MYLWASEHNICVDRTGKLAHSLGKNYTTVVCTYSIIETFNKKWYLSNSTITFPSKCPNKSVLGVLSQDPSISSEPRWPFRMMAYFWPAVNKEPIWHWPRYFLTRPYEIFLTRRAKKIENLRFIRGDFPNPEVADPTWPEQQKITLPGSKCFDWNPSLLRCQYWNRHKIWSG